MGVTVADPSAPPAVVTLLLAVMFAVKAVGSSNTIVPEDTQLFASITLYVCTPSHSPVAVLVVCEPVLDDHQMVKGDWPPVNDPVACPLQVSAHAGWLSIATEALGPLLLVTSTGAMTEHSVASVTVTV